LEKGVKIVEKKRIIEVIVIVWNYEEEEELRILKNINLNLC
jgi:hypothetical protein